MSFALDILRKVALVPETISISEVHDQNMVNKSNSNLRDDVATACKHFASFDVKAKSKVCVVASNSYQWIALDLAIVSTGAISIPLYHRSEPDELAFIIEHVQPDLIVYADAQLKRTIAPLLASKPTSVFLPDLFAPIDGPMPSAPVIDKDAIATIIYTSGTSGHPKGVCLTHANIDFMLTQTRSRLQRAKHGKVSRDRVFHYLPFCFAGSRLLLWTQLLQNNHLHLSTDLKNLAQEIKAVNPDYYLNVPVLLERIKQGVEQALTEKPLWLQKAYHNAKKTFAKKTLGQLNVIDKCWLHLMQKTILASIAKKIGSNLQFLVCGSAPLMTETQSWFSMLGIPVYQVYGLTETTAIVTMDTPSAMLEGWVGQPIEGIAIKCSEQGELLTKGPHIFQGYYKQLDKTEEVIKDGWFHTGDLCEIDDNKRIKILGRMKNVIIPSSGHNILPEPLEEQLCTINPNIEHACIVGHGKTKIGVVVASSSDAKDLTQTIETFNQSQPHYKKMAYVIDAGGALSQENGLLTANQKLKRNKIEAYFEEQISDKIQALQ